MLKDYLSKSMVDCRTSVETLATVRAIVPLKQIEYGVFGDLIVIYPKPYSIYLRATIHPEP